MTSSKKSLPEKVRDVARIVLCELGASPHGKLRETMLIREGNYCGHRYRLENLEAVWFIEEDELKFFDDHGAVARKMVASQAIEQILRQNLGRRAA